MKRNITLYLLMLLLCIALPINAFAAVPQKPMEAFYVNDFADVMNEDDANQMIALGTALEDACGAQVVAVVVSFLDGMDIEEYGTQLFEAWKLGAVDKDNGVLILLSVGDREITTILGTGIEDKFTHAVTGSYHDKYAIPYFLDNDFSQGMRADYQAHCDKVASIYGVSLKKSSAQQNNNAGVGSNGYNYDYDYTYTTTEGGISGVEIILGIIVILVILSLARTTRRGIRRMGMPRHRASWWFWPAWHWHSGPSHHAGPQRPRPPRNGPPRQGPPSGRSTGTGSFGGGFGGFGGNSTRSFGGGGSRPSGRTGGGSGKTHGGGSSRKF